FEDMTGGGGLHAARGEQVLHADRHARHDRQVPPGGAVGIHLLGGLEPAIGRGDDEGDQVRRCGHGIVPGFRHFSRGAGARGDSIADRLDAKLGQFAHYSITLGTPKKPCSAAGALASTASRTPPPVSGSASTTSSRKRSACGITAIIGSTSVT